MSVYLGVVSRVDAAGGLLEVSLPHLSVVAARVRCASPLGLVAPLPNVGDEVVLVATGLIGNLADAVCVGWLPTSLQRASADAHPLIVSTSGDVPRQSDPDQAISDASTSAVRARQ